MRPSSLRSLWTRIAARDKVVCVLSIQPLLKTAAFVELCLVEDSGPRHLLDISVHRLAKAEWSLVAVCSCTRVLQDETKAFRTESCREHRHGLHGKCATPKDRGTTSCTQLERGLLRCAISDIEDNRACSTWIYSVRDGWRTQPPC